jgi:hypothetical protein
MLVFKKITKAMPKEQPGLLFWHHGTPGIFKKTPNIATPAKAGVGHRMCFIVVWVVGTREVGSWVAAHSRISWYVAWVGFSGGRQNLE